MRCSACLGYTYPGGEAPPPGHPQQGSRAGANGLWLQACLAGLHGKCSSAFWPDQGPYLCIYQDERVSARAKVLRSA